MKFETENKYTLGQALVVGPIALMLYVGILIAFFPLGLYCAWCDLHIWNWFAAPYLHLPLMTLLVSYGIGSWVRLQTTSFKVVEGEKTNIWKQIGYSIVGHSISLLIAYLIHRYLHG